MSQPSAEPTALVLAAALLVAGLVGLLAWAGGDVPATASAGETSAESTISATVFPADEPAAVAKDLRAVTQPPAPATQDRRGTGGPDPAVAIDEPAPTAPSDTGETVAALCQRVGAKLGSVSAGDCDRIEFHFDGDRSVLGAPLVAADFGPPGSAQGRVLLLGGIHGDEYSSVSVVFRWLNALADEGELGQLDWRIIPLLNPDGLLRSRSQRMNHRGVDLNRNFPTENWDEDATDYWERRTGRNPRRYPGPEPLSEPESRYLHAQIRAFAPDLIVAVHAPLEVVDFDGPPKPPERLGSLYLHRMGTYPGSLGRYGGEQLGLPVVTIELSSAGIMPPTAEVRRIWRDLVDYARRTLAYDGDATVAAEPTAGADLR